MARHGSWNAGSCYAAAKHLVKLNCMTHEASDVQNNSQVWGKRLGNTGSTYYHRLCLARYPTGREAESHSGFASWKEESRKAETQGLAGSRGLPLIRGQVRARTGRGDGRHPSCDGRGLLLSFVKSGERQAGWRRAGGERSTSQQHRRPLGLESRAGETTVLLS